MVGVLRRSLTVLPFLVLVMTLLMAAPAWAQDTTLRVTKSDSVDPATVGEDLTYTIRVRNTGATETAENVRLEDFLPENTTFRSAAAAGGNCDEPDLGSTGGTVRCNLGDIAAGTFEEVTITVRPTAAAGEAGFVRNTAEAKGS
ncbi:MAG TPA: DUF11 domain-containing protein, partial [Rubrobacteraceae bacterium]|nr:DUF11 domain-containing protein [Rubrobacteraceae bacterium]